MHFQLTSEQQLIQQTARDFARDVLAPNAALVDEHQGETQYLENLKALGELGFMTMLVDEQWGGSNTGAVSYAIAVTEIARICASTAVAMSINNLVSNLLMDSANDDQKTRYLVPMCHGEKPHAGFCLTESGAGSNPAQMRASAQKVEHNGQTGWSITGSKQWITNGSIADFYIVWARTDESASAGKGISCFIVDRNSSGLSIGPHENKMGQRGNPTNEVIMQDCFVPDENVIGTVDQGFRYAVGGLVGGRLGIAALALGVATEALDYAARYMMEREQFGKPIIRHQGLQWMLSESATDLEAARLLLYQAAWLKDNDLPFTKQASMAKLFCSDKGNEICYKALQMIGGYGFIKEYPLERYCRDIRITSIYEGTSEIQKLIIGRALIQELEEGTA